MSDKCEPYGLCLIFLRLSGFRVLVQPFSCFGHSGKMDVLVIGLSGYEIDLLRIPSELSGWVNLWPGIPKGRWTQHWSDLAFSRV